MNRRAAFHRLAAAALLAPLALAAPVAARAQDAAEGLKIYFASGATSVSAEQTRVLDQAARLFRAGNPIVMIVAGGADAVGSPSANLQISLARANAVAQGLVARGIPVERLQVMGRGNSEMAVNTDAAAPENRVVDITWR